MADTFSIHGGPRTIRSWNGGRLNTNAHGPGTLVDEYGNTRQCTLNQGVISGNCWYTGTNGNKAAEVFNAQGMEHGTEVLFHNSGTIILAVYNNGEREGTPVQGMMFIQYI